MRFRECARTIMIKFKSELMRLLPDSEQALGGGAGKRHRIGMFDGAQGIVMVEPGRLKRQMLTHQLKQSRRYRATLGAGFRKQALPAHKAGTAKAATPATPDNSTASPPAPRRWARSAPGSSSLAWRWFCVPAIGAPSARNSG